MFLGGDDGVMGIHLAVIPRLAADLAVRLGHGAGQRRGRSGDGIPHLGRPVEVIAWQITAVGSGVGDELVALVEALADIQHPLGVHAEPLGGIDLQAGEVVRQWRRLLPGLLFHLLHPGWLTLDALHHLGSQRPVEHPPLLVLPGRTGLGRQPLGAEPFVALRHHMGQHLVEGFGHEGVYLEIPPHHQPQQRRLHPTDRQQLAAAGLAPKQGVGAGHVDAIEPVCAAAGQRRHRQRHELLVVPQLVEGAAHRGGIEITDEAALHRLGLGIAEEVDHLVHQQLPFPVRVTGIDHAVGLLDEPLDHGKLAPGLGLGHQLPLARHYGELLHAPLFVGSIIGIGLRLLQQVPDTPGHHVSLRRLDEALPLLVGLGQNIGDGAAKAGLFGNKESHD